MPCIRHKTTPVVVDAELVIGKWYDKRPLCALQLAFCWRSRTIQVRTKRGRHAQTRNDEILIQLLVDIRCQFPGVFGIRMKEQMNK